MLRSVICKLCKPFGRSNERLSRVQEVGSTGRVSSSVQYRTKQISSDRPIALLGYLILTRCSSLLKLGSVVLWHLGCVEAWNTENQLAIFARGSRFFSFFGIKVVLALLGSLAYNKALSFSTSMTKGPVWTMVELGFESGDTSLSLCQHCKHKIVQLSDWQVYWHPSCFISIWIET